MVLVLVAYWYWCLTSLNIVQMISDIARVAFNSKCGISGLGSGRYALYRVPF